jgi:hypothetical protein
MTKQRGYYTLKIGGKNRTLHFSMNFWATFTELLGISLDELGDVFQKGVSLKAIINIIYVGILTYDQENKKEIDYDNFDVGNWLEDITAEEIEKVIQAMTESRILGNDLNAGISRKETPADPKKK